MTLNFRISLSCICFFSLVTMKGVMLASGSFSDRGTWYETRGHQFCQQLLPIVDAGGSITLLVCDFQE